MDTTDSSRFPLVSGLRGGVLFALLAGAIISVYGFHYFRQRGMAEARQREAYSFLFVIVENGIRAHLRENHYHPDHLEDWFVGLMTAADLPGMRLSGRDDVAIMALGVYAQDDHAPILPPFLEMHRTTARFETPPAPRGWRQPPPGRGPMMRGGGGGGGWRPLPPGPYTVSLVLDETPWREQQAALRNQSLLGATITLGCATLGLFLFLLRERHRRLRLRLTESEATAQRQTRLALLGAGLAHETKNPLALIRGMAQILRDGDCEQAAARERAARIVEEVDRVVGEIDRFLSLARPVTPSLSGIALNDFFRRLDALLTDEAALSGIHFEHTETALVVRADSALLRRCLLNLLLNAFKACQSGDTVTLTAERGDDEHAVIVVRDTGCGITPEDLPRVLEPYFTRFNEGVGLGLAQVTEIVSAHGWRFDIRSTPGEGTEARILHIECVGNAP